MMRVTTVNETGCSSHLPLLRQCAECDKIALFDAKLAVDPETGEQKRDDDGTPVWVAEADLLYSVKGKQRRNTVFIEVPFRGDLAGRIRCHLEDNREWPSATFDNVRVERETEPSPGDPYPAPVFAAEWLHGDVAYEEQGWYGQLMRELGTGVGHGEG